MISGSRLGRARRPLCIDFFNAWRHDHRRLRWRDGSGNGYVAAVNPNTAQDQTYSHNCRHCPCAPARVNFARDFADDAYAKDRDTSDDEDIVEAHFAEHFQPVAHNDAPRGSGTCTQLDRRERCPTLLKKAVVPPLFRLRTYLSPCQINDVTVGNPNSANP